MVHVDFELEIHSKPCATVDLQTGFVDFCQGRRSSVDVKGSSLVILLPCENQGAQIQTKSNFRICRWSKFDSP